MQLRVYYDDTDAGGIVYHTNYIKYCERARSDKFFKNNKKLGENNCHYVVKNIEANFIKPAFLGDLLHVKTDVLEVKNASVIIFHEIYREELLLFNAKILLAYVKDGKPIKMPQIERDFFLNMNL